MVFSEDAHVNLHQHAPLQEPFRNKREEKIGRKAVEIKGIKTSFSFKEIETERIS